MENTSKFKTNKKENNNNKKTTVVPTKSDNDVIFCSQLSSKPLTCTLRIEELHVY